MENVCNCDCKSFWMKASAKWQIFLRGNSNVLTSKGDSYRSSLIIFDDILCSSCFIYTGIVSVWICVPFYSLFMSSCDGWADK